MSANKTALSMNKAALLKIKHALLKKCHLKAENIPWGYARCFNDTCKRKDTCMHYLARVLTNQQERHIGQAVYPTAWQESECPCYMEKRLARKAWGFSHLYDNVPHYRKAEARQRVRSYFKRHGTLLSFSSRRKQAHTQATG